MIVGLVVECCCHGRNFSLFVDPRLILSTDNSVVKWDMHGAFVENSAIAVGSPIFGDSSGDLLLSHRALSWIPH